MKTQLIGLIAFLCLLADCRKPETLRKEISLNGIWEITRTDSLTVLPSSFMSEIPVPGLVDMARPGIDKQDTAYNNAVYWYKKTFALNEPDAGVIRLKINKAGYHTCVYLNGKMVGENVNNFTPSLFDLKPFLNQSNHENELVIAVGCKNDLPDTVTHGGDFEKTKYIPGIYDDVKLIVTGFPYITNIQTVPDIINQQLRVLAEIQSDGSATNSGVSYLVREVSTKKIISKGSAFVKEDGQTNFLKYDFKVKMEDCNLWTPETPFLYDLELSTSGDKSTTRFGMRTFETSKDSGVFLLNGRPYYLRGTNVCIFRFFEDPDRDGLPWDRDWIAKLHKSFKDMHWNSIRYCIGFPPEKWYEIADSIGFLIQDEYPLWTGGNGGFENSQKGITSGQLAAEYRQWMRERWNHPCVVIWDAQNESVNDTTALAIQMVRKLDLSNRPWDNGWAAPASVNDIIESHPYLFIRYMNTLPGPGGYLKELLNEPLIPGNDPNERTPLPDGKRYENKVILINEYGWLWLNRNGTTTTLTDNVYANVFPEAVSPDLKLEVYAKNLGILTEFWRSHRKAGGVMHFCGLGYSRPEYPRGQTSDNFTDIKTLTYGTDFYKYVRPAFSPVGIMLEFWEKSVKQGEKRTIRINLINDTYDSIKDSLRLNFYSGEELISSHSVIYTIAVTGKTKLEIPVSFPNYKGRCRMEAEIRYQNENVKSIREFTIE